MYQGKFEAKNRPAAQPGYTPEQTREETRQAYKPHQSAANAARQQMPQARPQQSRPQGVQQPRPQGARPQQRPAPAPAPAKKGPHLDSIIFYTLYFLLIAVFCLGMAVGVNWLNGWLVDYEAAQPTAKSQEVFNQLFASPDWASLYEQAGCQDTAYEGKDAFAAYMTQKVGGTQLTYTETSAGLSQGKKYYVKLGDERIGAFYLTNQASKKTDIPDWELGKVELIFDRADGYLIQKVDGHRAFVNGVELDDSFTIQTTSTSAEEFLPVGTVGAKIDVQSITGLMMRPTVSIQDQSGTEMPVVYDEEKGMFVEQTEATAISDAEKTAVMGALEAYSGYMINASGARQNVAKYFDSNSDAYKNIMKIGAELWMNTDRGHKFLDETITDYVKYTDELFSCKASLTMQVTLKDGSLSSYDVEESMFFRLKNGNWVCYGMTNKDVTKPVGKVRITFISDLTDGITLSSQFYETDAATLMTPVITAPEGKIFSGWVKETTVNGRTELTVVFTPDENGQVTVPAGTTLEPMTLYALFENAE